MGICAPHHTASLPGLIGGGAGRVRPGMVSLAHRGVLFLDELPEFGAKLDSLRQPLEDRVVTLSRSVGSVTYPAAVMLVAAQNPCPCGYHGDAERTCTCSPALISRYQKRVSGPLLDRIDIHVAVPRVGYEKLASDRLSESSAAIRERVVAARQRQHERFVGTRLLTNSDMGAADVRQCCPLDGAGQSLMRAAVRQVYTLHMSGYAKQHTRDRIVALAGQCLDLAKNIFDKTGVHSRRELVGKVFFAYYEPRVSDNEQRAVDRCVVSRYSGVRTLKRRGITACRTLRLPRPRSRRAA